MLEQLIENVHLITLDPEREGAYGLLPNAWLGIQEGKIHSLGQGDAPEAEMTVDGQGQFLSPGLIDCHNHLIWGGNRAEEFEWRLQGRSYQEIAQAGGGIASTVKATRDASDEELYQGAAERLQTLLDEGVTTVEVKSGYGLSLEHELRVLRIAKQLGEAFPVQISTTLLAAHALPPEFKDNSDAYIDLVCEEIIPAAAGENLADCVDVFCEGVGFSPEQCRRVFESARAHRLPVKGHVEQLSDLGGAKLVAEFHGWSVDHIEYLRPEDVPSLKPSGTVAVLLPGAFYSLKETQMPPIQALREAGVPMAVATDLNPGTSPLASLRLAMNQACVLFGLTPEESLRGVSQYAAQALGLGKQKGILRIGFDADLVLWNIKHPSELSYGFNLVKPAAVLRNGAWI
ncbi:imidazolonepropionase [Pseudoteredinibacter isoporae]|nr:imidazolonepropionase [Pseudoteredinibacter isoporae]NHO87600.1 imidazolonepropionase [Pseudoteredinibacter isoporae]NIB24069.1 imidazolonepropionase [Pseudoteredinibacter isoporae]